MSASVLICPYTKLTWGHLTRCFALAETLVALGHRVAFACAPDARSRVEGAGFTLVELTAMDRQDLLRPPRTAKDAAAGRTWLAEELDAAGACLRELAPDVVVGDLQPIVNIAASLAAIPSASLLNLELLVSPLSWWLPGLERILGELDVPRWAARRTFGDMLVVADAASVTGLRDLAPELAARIAASVRELRFVGPILGELPTRAPAAERRSPRPRPEVVVSLGGNSGYSPTADIIIGCARVEADLVIVAPQATPEILAAADAARAAGRRVEVVAFIADFSRRLAEADALITHGGHGTLTLAAALGVPTLVVPGSLEQEINAKRLHGAGAVASPIPSELRAGVGDQLAALLHDRAGDAARVQLARSLAMYDGACDAALAVQRLAQTRPAEASW